MNKYWILSGVFGLLMTFSVLGNGLTYQQQQNLQNEQLMQQNLYQQQLQMEQQQFYRQQQQRLEAERDFNRSIDSMRIKEPALYYNPYFTD